MEIIIFLTVSPERHRTAEENLGIEYLASNFGSEAGTSGIMETVTNLLDANKDGNVVDDIMGMVGKFFGGNK